MLKQKFILFLLNILILFFAACSAQHKPVPVGSIPKHRAVSVQEEQYGHTVLQELSKKWPLDYDDPRLNKVIKIVDDLTLAAGASSDPWHVYLFKAPEVKNAAATRGNHVFVWSGMLDWTQNDDELATILGHEIAHVLARHTDPNPNDEARKMLIRVGAIAAGIAVSRGLDGGQAAATLGNLTVATTEQLGKGLLTNPYSRQLEHEADHVGLMIMSEAKYDPNKALDFWQRAATDPSFGGGSSAFFSTHPPALDRLDKIKEAIPIAEKRKSGTYSEPIPLGISKATSKTTSEVPSQSLQKSSKSSDEKNSQYAQSWKEKYYDENNSETLNSPEAITSQSINTSSKKPRPKFKNTNSKTPTFAVDDPDKQSVITSNSIWRVTSSVAHLFQKPNENSRKIGELKRGGKVKAREDLGKWLKVFSPDFGYIKKSKLAQVYPR